MTPSVSRPFQLVLALALLTVSLTACAGPKGDSAPAKRNDADRMRRDTLAQFYAREPYLREKVSRAVGYGTFSGVGTHTIIVTAGQAFGIVHDNATGKDTYMRAVKLGGGLGVGAAKSSVLVIFNDSRTLNEFVTRGWNVGGSGEAAARDLEGQGTGAGLTVTLPGMEIYRITDKGVMVSGALAGTKVWRDEELN